MLYPQTPLDQWIERYSIQTKDLLCPACGSELKALKPLAIKGYRGVEAEACTHCNHDSGIFRVVPVDSKKLELWESLRPSGSQAVDQ